jgi:hypothetical protein
MRSLFACASGACLETWGGGAQFVVGRVRVSSPAGVCGWWAILEFMRCCGSIAGVCVNVWNLSGTRLEPVWNPSGTRLEPVWNLSEPV